MPQSRRRHGGDYHQLPSRAALLFLLSVVAMLSFFSNAFHLPLLQQQPQQHQARHQRHCRHTMVMRRQALSRSDSLTCLSGGAFAAAALLLCSSPVLAASEKASAYFPQIVSGYKEFKDMYGPEWEATKALGGDQIRRRLGIVGIKSPLFKIDKALKVVQEALIDGQLGEDVGDPFDFADAAQRVLEGIKNADFLAYSNNFSSYGNGGGGTDFLEESHKAMEPAIAAYEELMGILRLEKK